MKIRMHAHSEDKFSSMARQMGNWVDHVLGSSGQYSGQGTTWAPAINVCQDDEQYCVVVDIAGVKADEIDLSVEDKHLTISGYRQTPHPNEHTGNVTMHHMEIDHGPFSRTIELPDDVLPEKVEACYRQGFLWIRIPKAILESE